MENFQKAALEDMRTDGNQTTSENSYAEMWILEAKKIQNPNASILISATKVGAQTFLMKRFLNMFDSFRHNYLKVELEKHFIRLSVLCRSDTL